MKAKTQTIEGFCAYHPEDGWCWPTFMIFNCKDILLMLGGDGDEINWQDDEFVVRYWTKLGWKILPCKMTLEGELEE